MIKFIVYGTPAPMGSKKAFAIKSAKTGKHRAVITDDNSPRRKAFANAVSAAARGAMVGRQMLTGAVSLRIEFAFERPKHHFRTGRNAGILSDLAPSRHTVKPDADKLERCLLDALSGIVYRDDAQVCVTVKSKVWTTGKARATVEVIPLEEGAA